GDPGHLFGDPGCVPAGQSDVRRALAVHLHHVAGELHARTPVVTDGDLEDAAWTNRQEVRIVRVVIDDAPFGAEHLHPVHDPAPARLGPPVRPRLPAPVQPAGANLDGARPPSAAVGMARAIAAAGRMVRITITSGHETFLHRST